MLLTPLSFQHSSTLAYKREDLRILVADEAGYQRAVPTDATKLARVDAAIKLGSQWFYAPTPIEGPMYEWSFLHPIHTINTIVGQWEYDLPFDYAGHEGFITFGPSTGYMRIPFVAPFKIRDARMVEGAISGVPRMAAVTIVQRDIPQSQLYVLQTHPIASEVWALSFKMNLAPPEVSDAYPFVYGSAIHADAILSCCFAAWESLYVPGQQTRRKEMVERVQAAIERDRKTIRQEFIGINSDNSDARRRGRRNTAGWDVQTPYPSTMTYNGVAI